MSLTRLPHSIVGWLGEVGVRVVFSDESGTGSQVDEPNMVVAAIMLNLDRQWPILPRDVDSLIAFHGYDPRHYELKGTSLMRAIRKQRIHPSAEHQDHAERAQRIWAGALAKLYEHKVPVFIAAANRAGFAHIQYTVFGGASAYVATFADCLRQVDNYAHTSLKDEQVLWISDHAGEHETDLKEVLDLVRELQKTHFKDAYPLLDPIGPHFAHITDTIYFGHSKESRALQLADLCATTIAYYFRGETIVNRFVDVMRPQLVNTVAPLFLGIDRMRDD